MSSRALIYSTGIIIVGMLILIGLNLSSIFQGKPEGQTYLRRENIQGIAIQHDQLLYTLNFKQQNTLVDIVNEAVQIEAIPAEHREPPQIEAIVVYLFNRKAPLTLHPIAYINHNLVFSVPEWNTNGYLQERSEGGLKQLLSQSYDP